MLSRFWIVLDDVIYGTVEDHEPRGVTGDNLCQNSGGRRYLLVPTLVGYQSVQNLLPDVLFVLGGDAFLTTFLNGSKPVLEPILVCRWTRFSADACHGHSIANGTGFFL